MASTNGERAHNILPRKKRAPGHDPRGSALCQPPNPKEVYYVEVYTPAPAEHQGRNILAERRRYSVRQAIKRLKAEIPLETYAGELTELKRQGANLVGLCPIHDEKTPSFYVYPDDRFYCFGCKHCGDIIDLCEAVEHHAECWTAAISLATRFGIELPRRPERWHEWQGEKHRRRQMMRDALAQAYRRRYFKLLGDFLEDIDDREEREAEARKFWEGLWPVAQLSADGRLGL